jgi:hypothetical protein
LLAGKDASVADMSNLLLADIFLVVDFGWNEFILSSILN